MGWDEVRRLSEIPAGLFRGETRRGVLSFTLAPIPLVERDGANASEPRRLLIVAAVGVVAAEGEGPVEPTGEVDRAVVALLIAPCAERV